MREEFASAVIEHDLDYNIFYHELVIFVKRHFSSVECGLQCDGWIHIKENGYRVSLDTFESMQFEIKSDSDNELLRSVIEVTRDFYRVRIYDEPVSNY